MKTKIIAVILGILQGVIAWHFTHDAVAALLVFNVGAAVTLIGAIVTSILQEGKKHGIDS